MINNKNDNKTIRVKKVIAINGKNHEQWERNIKMKKYNNGPSCI